jgi:hypothetical protein
MSTITVTRKNKSVTNPSHRHQDEDNIGLPFRVVRYKAIVKTTSQEQKPIAKKCTPN